MIDDLYGMVSSNHLPPTQGNYYQSSTFKSNNLITFAHLLLFMLIVLL